jgi:hypothetical protein
LDFVHWIIILKTVKRVIGYFCQVCKTYYHEICVRVLKKTDRLQKLRTQCVRMKLYHIAIDIVQNAASTKFNRFKCFSSINFYS